MKQSKVVRSDIKVLYGIIWSLASKRLLDFIDFASVITCIWTLFWLIYFNFVKDFIEILVYATFKYINRFRWLYRLLQLDNLLKHIDDFLETREHGCLQETDKFPPKEIVENSPVIVSGDNSMKEQFSRWTPQCTPCSLKNKREKNPRFIDFNEEPSSAGANFRGTNLNPEENTVLVSEKNILPRPEENTFSSPEENGDFSAEKVFDSNQNVISNPKSNIVVRPEVNYEPDAVFVSPGQESGSKRKFFTWNFNKVRDSFRKENGSKLLSAHSIKTKCENLVAEVIKVQPSGVGDKKRLILSNDSPVNVSCCNSLFITFKSKLQMKENVPRSMHYKRF